MYHSHIFVLICYIFYYLFMLSYFYFDVHNNSILIDFYYNYLSTFDLDTDNTVYSSGDNTDNTVYSSGDNTDNTVYSSGGNNRFYDPVRDIYRSEGGNPQGGDPQGGDPQGGDPQGGNPQNVQDTLTHTEELANYLRDKHSAGARTLLHTKIFFLAMPDSDADRISLIAKCVREAHPDFFYQRPRNTVIIPLIDNLDTIRENYPRVRQ